MKAYCVDLRQKILETYKNKEGSIRQVSMRFKVSRSFVQKLLKQHQQTGSLTHATSWRWYATKID